MRVTKGKAVRYITVAEKKTDIKVNMKNKIN
jgi:hypothetical protein